MTTNTEVLHRRRHRGSRNRPLSRSTGPIRRAPSFQEVERHAQPLTEVATKCARNEIRRRTPLKAAQAQIELLQGQYRGSLPGCAARSRLRNNGPGVTKLKSHGESARRSPTSRPAAKLGPPGLSSCNSISNNDRSARFPSCSSPARRTGWKRPSWRRRNPTSIVRKSLSTLRTLAKTKFGRLLRPALLKYTEANHGDLPTDLLQLKPFFTEPVDDALLQRYEMVATGNTGDPGFDPFKRLVREKAEAAARQPLRWEHERVVQWRRPER